MPKIRLHLMVYVQSSVLFLVCLTFWKLDGFCSFYSGLLGSIVSMVPYFFFANRTFRYRGAYYSKQIISNIYSGIMIKWIMTLLGFSLIFTMIHPLNPISVFSLFIIGQGLIWLTPWLIRSDRSILKNNHIIDKYRTI